MKQKPDPISEGQIFLIPYPFAREMARVFDGEGYSDTPTWTPKLKMESLNDGEVIAVANGIGEQVITVIGTYNPSGYPMRVFYTRKWKDPDGKMFGNRGCRVISVAAFRSLIRGYRHPFVIREQKLIEAPKIRIEV